MFGLESLPDGFWQTVFASRMAGSPRAGDLLLYAAYRGDLSTVRALITHGVPADAKDHTSWRTALHGAAAKGDTKTIQYLLSQGAHVNALDRSGDSPLELADENGQETAAKFLVAHGAQRIRGDEAQHRKAIDDEVKEDIEQLRPGRGRRSKITRRHQESRTRRGKTAFGTIDVRQLSTGPVHGRLRRYSGVQSFDVRLCHQAIMSTSMTSKTMAKIEMNVRIRVPLAPRIASARKKGAKQRGF